MLSLVRSFLCLFLSLTLSLTHSCRYLKTSLSTVTIMLLDSQDGSQTSQGTKRRARRYFWPDPSPSATAATPPLGPSSSHVELREGRGGVRLRKSAILIPTHLSTSHPPVWPRTSSPSSHVISVVHRRWSTCSRRNSGSEKRVSAPNEATNGMKIASCGFAERTHLWTSQADTVRVDQRSIMGGYPTNVAVNDLDPHHTMALKRRG